MITETNEYHFEYSEDPSSEDVNILFEGLSNEAFLKRQLEPMKSFGIFIKNSQSKVVAGATGVTYYGCLYVDMLFVESQLRDQGFGKKLMMEAEKIGQDRGCLFSTVATMDFEALPFYQKLGYEIEFIREGYEKESKLFMLRKKL